MFTKIITSALSCHNGRKSWMKSFNQVSLTGTLFQNTIALCIVVMDTEHEMLINFFLWSINLYYFSELFDLLCKKRPHRRICLLRKVLMTRLNLFHFLFNQRPLLVSQLMTNKERAQFNYICCTFTPILLRYAILFCRFVVYSSHFCK